MAIAYIIPCSDAKRDTPQAARSLYVGAMFTNTLAAALALAADDDALVLIMSAKYGLVRLDDVLAPYNQRIDAKGAVDAATLQSQIEALGLDWQDDVYSMLPAKYFKVLDDALRPLDMFASNVYEGARGIGDQRHINASAY